MADVRHSGTIFAHSDIGSGMTPGPVVFVLDKGEDPKPWKPTDHRSWWGRHRRHRCRRPHGDGKIDIVAGGRATHNVRLDINRGSKQPLRNIRQDMDFLQLADRTFLVIGVANRKSIAWQTAKVLTEAGANVVYSVRSEQRVAAVKKLAGDDAKVYICDYEHQAQIDALRDQVSADVDSLSGIVHSIAFADYSAGWLPFHETPRPAFLQAVDISCYSLIAVCNAFQELLDAENGSVVTISISTTKMAAENYGFMAPVKAALDSTVCFLAKSFSKFSKVRFNAVCPGLLKTSASAGIPGYIDSYLFAEKATLRKQGLRTDEVANTVAFLLSPRSSGINAQGIVLDAGMAVNYFDDELIKSDQATE